jgi:metal-sulfur cluster biosynthetic enzyme
VSDAKVPRASRFLEDAAVATAGGSAEGAAVALAGGPAEEAAVERLWTALAEVDDPEVPVSVLDMGLIVAVDYSAVERTAALKITYTAMGCPAMDMIQDDIRTRLLREDGVDHVDIEVVWDPVWTERRLSQRARGKMRGLGLAV